MKAKFQILVIMIIFSSAAFAHDSLTVKVKHYFISATIVNSGSGQGMGYSLTTAVNDGRKTLEVGLIFDQRDGKISGANVQYRINLGNNINIPERSPKFIPYLQYQLLYQKGMSYADELVVLEGEEYFVKGEPGVVTTIGHYLETGARIRLFDRMFIDSAIGLGAYFGSMDKINGPGTWGFHKENSGFTYSYKIGFTYMLR